MASAVSFTFDSINGMILDTSTPLEVKKTESLLFKFIISDSVIFGTCRICFGNEHATWSKQRETRKHEMVMKS